MLLTEEQRKELQEKLMTENQGMSGRERGALIGGITQGLTDIATAGTGVERRDVGATARQIGQAQDDAGSFMRQKWKESLERDRQAQQDKYQKDRDIKTDKYRQDMLDLKEKSLTQPKGKAAQTKAYDFMNTPKGLVRVNRVTGTHELMQESPAKIEKPKSVPAGVAVQQGELTAAGKVLDDLAASHQGLDKGLISSGIDYAAGRMGAPNTEGDIFEKQRRAAAQTVGSILEGGKLTDADFENKYLPLFPGPLDTAESAEAKINNIRTMLQRKQEGATQGLQEAGFDVDGDLSDLNKAAEGLETPVNEVKRQTKDGRTAIFNADTKEFIRYE